MKKIDPFIKSFSSYSIHKQRLCLGYEELYDKIMMSLYWQSVPIYYFVIVVQIKALLQKLILKV